MVQAPGPFAARKNLTFSQYHKPAGLSPRILTLSPYQGPGAIPGNLTLSQYHGFNRLASANGARPQFFLVPGLTSEMLSFSQCLRETSSSPAKVSLFLNVWHLLNCQGDLTLSRPLPVTNGTHSNLNLSQCFGPALRRVGARVNAEPRACLLLNVLDSGLGAQTPGGNRATTQHVAETHHLVPSTSNPFNLQLATFNLQPATCNLQLSNKPSTTPRSL